MKKIAIIFLFLCLVIVIQADTRKSPHQKNVLDVNIPTTQNHPYLFLTTSRGRFAPLVERFEVKPNDDTLDESEKDDSEQDFIIERSDDVTDYNNDQDDASQLNNNFLPKQPISLHFMSTTSPSAMVGNDYSNKEYDEMRLGVTNTNPTQMLISREHAGAIMVPDGIIEVDGQTIIDEKTGNAALLLLRDEIKNIPNGSVVAVMERSIDNDEIGEERANRVIVRRRRKGSRRNVRRRKNKNNSRRRRGNIRRRVNNRKNANAVRYADNRRWRGNKRRNGYSIVTQS